MKLFDFGKLSLHDKSITFSDNSLCQQNKILEVVDYRYSKNLNIDNEFFVSPKKPIRFLYKTSNSQVIFPENFADFQIFNDSSNLLVQRAVGAESSKTLIRKDVDGFFTKYMSGEGLDVGFDGYEDLILPILPNAIGVGLNYPGYDGRNLPFSSNSKDYVYASHTLEHIVDCESAIEEWLRVVKPDGYVIIVVPHRDLYEKNFYLPSHWNSDHKRFYTSESLLHEINAATYVNQVRIRSLEERDFLHDYTLDENHHANFEYSIELVIQKLEQTK